MNKKAYVFIGTIVSIILFVTYYYFNVFERTAAVVTLIEKGQNNQVIVQFESGEKKKVVAPDIIRGYLEEQQKYFMVIYDNNLRKAFIAKIEPEEIK